ncbi:Fc receptor-like protein 4 isoform X3 [Felis catus]|uniref:Fc receptor-like protein 4 isoform X3 n=1 Tax=Felis catus TaxID=9685 RepID=UPI001D19999B|nr:Fc receptor-like protein 4 isoform X3 [Felis catus]
MLLWASLLVLAPVCGQLEAASKPVISLHPPWTVAFKGETVTLTCNVFHFHAPEKIKRFLWYLGRRMLRETPGNTLEVRDSGQYRCQTQDSLPSDQVNMIFSSDWLVLQAPHGVFEGDTLVLRCQTRSQETLTSVKYIWNGKVISASNQSQDLSIPRASSNNSGFYHCTGRVDKMHTWRSNAKSVQIQASSGTAGSCCQTGAGPRNCRSQPSGDKTRGHTRAGLLRPRASASSASRCTSTCRPSLGTVAPRNAGGRLRCKGSGRRTRARRRGALLLTEPAPSRRPDLGRTTEELGVASSQAIATQSGSTRPRAGRTHVQRSIQSPSRLWHLSRAPRDRGPGVRSAPGDPAPGGPGTCGGASGPHLLRGRRHRGHHVLLVPGGHGGESGEETPAFPEGAAGDPCGRREPRGGLLLHGRQRPRPRLQRGPERHGHRHSREQNGPHCRGSHWGTAQHSCPGCRPADLPPAPEEVRRWFSRKHNQVPTFSHPRK